MRYINVTLINDTGSPMTTQLQSRDEGILEAVDWVEQRLLTRRETFVAAFIYDTRAKQLFCYEIDGLRARLIGRRS